MNYFCVLMFILILYICVGNGDKLFFLVPGDEDGKAKFDSFIITNGRKPNGDDHMQFKRKLYTIVVARIS
jgi:hypothetical protein